MPALGPFRRTGVACTLVAATAISATLAAAWGQSTLGGGGHLQAAQSVPAERTYNGQPFEYRVLAVQEKPSYWIYHLSYPSPVVGSYEPNNTVPAEYYLPRGLPPSGPKRPAVICLHILDGNFVLARMACSTLASHGIPAMMFKMPYYGERGLADGPRALARDPKLFTEAIAQAWEDVRRAVDVLASRPEVDPERIGITGISLGGIVAASAAGRDPRLHRAMLILAGGDLVRVIYHAEETELLRQMLQSLPADRRAEVESKIAAVDPVQQAPGLRQRAQQGLVLMVNAAEDEVIPRPCTEKLAAALGIADQVVWLEGLGHYTAMAELPRVLQTMVEFFGRDMPSGAMPPQPVRKKRPLDLLAAMLSQAAGMVTSEPGEGRCHFLDVELSATTSQGNSVPLRLRWIRGHGGRFRLEGQLPELGQVCLGQSEYPWICSADSARRKAFVGTGGEVLSSDPLAFARPEGVTWIRTLAGAAAGMAMVPDVFTQWIAVTDARPADNPRTIAVQLQEGAARATITLRDKAAAPASISFQAPGLHGEIRFHGWQLDTVAHPSMFAPPSDCVQQQVDRADVYRMMGAMFDFAVENVQ